MGDLIDNKYTSFAELYAKPGIPGAYARVDQFIDWINKVTNTVKKISSSDFFG